MHTHAGHVATDPNGRQTRGAFVPNKEFEPCYDAVVFPALLLHKLHGDSTRVDACRRIANAWLKPGGQALPAPDAVQTEKVRYALSRTSWFGAVSDDAKLQDVGVWGALLGGIAYSPEAQARHSPSLPRHLCSHPRAATLRRPMNGSMRGTFASSASETLKRSTSRAEPMAMEVR